MGKTSSHLIRAGLWAGVAGGLAEIVVISTYSAATGTSAADVARGVTAAVGVQYLSPAGSVVFGIGVHMILAVMLGLALAVAAQRIWPNRLASVAPAAVVATLVAIWAINFFVVLPVVSAAFVQIVPLPVSLLSKFLFGIAAAEVFRRSAAADSQRGTSLLLHAARS